MTAVTNTPPQNGGAVARRDPRAQTLQRFLESDTIKEQISRALPSHLEFPRLLRQVMTLVQTNMDLLSCSPASVYQGILRAAELGLELSGPLGHCYLVPRKISGEQQATFQIGYKGLAELSYRSGRVAVIEAHAVCEKDCFEYQYGLHPDLQHKPFRGGPRGPVTYYYAVAIMASGAPTFEVMSKPEVEAHRDRYCPSAKSSRSGWQTSFDAMAMKTVVIKLCNRLPKSTEIQKALDLDREVIDSTAGALPSQAVPSRTDALAESLGALPEAEPEPESPEDSHEVFDDSVGGK